MSQFSSEYAYYDRLHAEKYRDENQDRKDHCANLAHNLASNKSHEELLFDALINNRFIPAGRIQAALGAREREVSPFNCSVSQKIEDSMTSIMSAQSNAVKILRLGTGIGYNFSHLRPHGDLIVKLKTKASGPLSFMRGFNEYASVIASSGHRRGAQMGILNVDHPDIEAFIDAKMQKDKYQYFNFSVGITHEFMYAVHNDKDWQLKFGGKVYKVLKARELWDKIMRNAYMSAEPGVIFLDRINETNNLWYCEHIEATNPCAEQPLPPFGLCTLGSFNMIAYMDDPELLEHDAKIFVEAYDNIFDNALYAIPEHKQEALNKRRIGLGFTGIANAIEYALERPCYGSGHFCQVLEHMCSLLTYHCYSASIKLAKERGAFPLFDAEKYSQSKFIGVLPDDLQADIFKYGIRNSHIISYAPCGTISQAAGNISSGVEPIFYHKVDRKVYMKDGLQEVTLQDYNVRERGFYGKTIEECTIEDHTKVLGIIQKYTDSAVSKTINVAPSTTFEEYKNVYWNVYELGAKGCTVFRPTEIRGAVIMKAKEEIKEVRTSNCKDGVCSM